MAKLKLTFVDEINPTITSTIETVTGSVLLRIFYNETNTIQSIYLDVPTAIKFHKTLRAEINKAKEFEDGTR